MARAPSVGTDVSPSLNGTAAAITGVEGLGVDKIAGADPYCKLQGKNSKKGAASQLPAQAYEDATEVPSEFVIKDPTAIATRGCDNGDDDCELPVIDMSPLMTLGAEDQQGAHQEDAARNVTVEIGRACETWGFFLAINHGISEDLLDCLIKAGHEFFRLPLEEKQVYSAEPGETEGYGHIPDGQVRGWTDNLRHTIRPRPVPEKDRLPSKPAAYRGLIKEYIQEIENLRQIVLRALSEFLGLEPNALRKAQGDDWTMAVRLNYYPKCPEPARVMGIGAHKDFGSMTVLTQDEVGGLQVAKPGCENVWLDVKPRKGLLLINISNQVEILSNGRLHSCLHRVLTHRNKARLSIATFINPGPECIIRPLPELLEKTQQLPLYKESVFKDYFPNMKKDWKAGVPPHIRYEINRNKIKAT